MRSLLTNKLLTRLGFAAAALVVVLGLVTVAEAPYAAVPQQPPETTVLFFGDMMLDRNVARRAAGDGASLVAGVQSLAQEADAVVVNLEGTITTNESIAQRDNKILRFTFAPEVARGALTALGVDAVSLANNHALDFYAAGYSTTQEYVTSWGIAPFGHPLNSKDLSTTLVVNTLRLCLVGYHELYDPSTATTIAEITRLRPLCDKIVVMTHWGPEYEPLPAASQVAEGRAFIDAGADLVVGMHPHVVQPVEVYNGRVIAYSLGNFIFDQDFSWETEHGIALKVVFAEGETRITVVPLAIRESRPEPIFGEEAGRVVQAAGGVDTLVLP